MHVNLLPFAFQRKQLLHRLVRKWTATWMVCALAIGLFIGFRYLTVVRQRDELQQVELGCAEIRAVVASTLQLETSLNGMLACRGELSRLEPDQDALAALAIVAQAVQATKGRAQIDTIQFHEPRSFVATRTAAAGPARGGAPIPSATAEGTITVNGIAADDEAVATLIDSMHRVPLMQKVELRSSSAVDSDGTDRRRFEIVCRY